MPNRMLIVLILGLCIVIGGCQTKPCCGADGPRLDWPETMMEFTPTPTPQVMSEAPVLEEAVPVDPISEDIEELAPIEENPIESVPPPIEENPFTQQAVLKCLPEGERTASVGTPIELICKVTNTGSVAADSYQLQITLPEGLNYQEPAQSKVWSGSFGRLEVNASNAHSIKVVSLQPGTYSVQGDLQVADQVVDSCQWNIEFTGDTAIKLLVDAPAKTRIGQPFTYKISVVNKGAVMLSGVVLKDRLYKGDVSYGSSIPEGSYNPKNNIITWNIGNMPPNDQRSFEITVTPTTKELVVNQALVKDGSAAAKDKLQVETEIIGEIGLQIQHYDTDDPVEVNEITTYVATVTNQGDKSAQQVVIVDIIPEQSQFVEARVEGTDTPLGHKIEGNKVIFDPIPELKPWQKVTFKITVRVKKSGDLLNTIEARSASFGTPFQKQEPTKAFRSDSPEEMFESPDSPANDELPADELPADDNAFIDSENEPLPEENFEENAGEKDIEQPSEADETKTANDKPAEETTPAEDPLFEDEGFPSDEELFDDAPLEDDLDSFE